MAIRIGSNFNYTQRKPLDSRQSFKTIAALKTASDNYVSKGIFDGLIALVESTSEFYIFNSNNASLSDIGMWRLLDDPISEQEIRDVVQ